MTNLNIFIILLKSTKTWKVKPNYTKLSRQNNKIAVYLRIKMKIMDTQDIGKKGEALAEALLLEKGYEVIQKNYIANKGEIDLIAWSPPMPSGKKILVFVEVKTRGTDYFGKPEQFVGKKKQLLVSRTAGHFMEEIHYDWAVRFDIISVLFRNDKLKNITHIQDAFFPIG